MAQSRKDPKGRKLKEGESWRSDGRYSYRYTDPANGKRHTVYAPDLPELREKEKLIKRDLEDRILTDTAIKKMTLNQLFECYMATRELADSTRTNYLRTWENRVKFEIGTCRVTQLLPSHIKAYYTYLSQQGYAFSTIKFIHNMIYPALEMAVDDDIIRKNPSKSFSTDYGKAPRKREALTVSQQEKFLDFVKKHVVYKAHYPMLVIMLGTGLRCGELIGLTWSDIDTKLKTVSVDHQLIYKNLGEGCQFYISTPKTYAGIRRIPMTQEVQDAFKAQRELNFMLVKDRNYEIDGYKGFIFTAKSGRPLMPNAVNNVLYNIVGAYNQQEKANAKKEGRDPELLPKISAHIMRHTACTRMAEQRMDIKVLQYVMGHAHIGVTMEVYNHLAGMNRIEKEIARLDGLVMNG